MRLRYHVGAELRRNHSPYDLARMVRYVTSFLAGRVLGRRALVDDPDAMLASEWLADRVGCRVVVVVRDPAAIAGSWKRLGWTTNLGELLHQPALMPDWLEPYRGQMEALAAAPEDLPGRVGMLWRLLHLLVGEYARRCAGLRIVRYEDLAADPLPAFGELYADLGLRFDERARRAVVRSTTATRGGGRTAGRCPGTACPRPGTGRWTAAPTWPPGSSTSAPRRPRGSGRSPPASPTAGTRRRTDRAGPFRGDRPR